MTITECFAETSDRFLATTVCFAIVLYILAGIFEGFIMGFVFFVLCSVFCVLGFVFCVLGFVFWDLCSGICVLGSVFCGDSLYLNSGFAATLFCSGRIVP